MAVKAQFTIYLTSIKSVSDVANYASEIADALDETTYGTVTYEYDNQGTVETVYKNKEFNYYYYLDGETEVRVSEADLVKDETTGEVIKNRAQDGLDYLVQVAGQKASEAWDYADQARTSAETAEASATSANASASNALSQLSVVESVVGVLDLLSKHGTYSEITDTEAVAENGKWYFTRSGAGTTADPYTYAVVDVPVGDSVTGYYELTDIDQAVTNYVSSHLALTDDGLSLQQDGSDYRILISTDGLKIIGANGATVASYGTETTIGSATGFNVKITGTELGFYQGTQRVAYINNNQLYITQSVVLQQMDLGIPVASGGLGQWSWKVHPNGQNPRRNNLNLKWIG